MKMSKVGNQTNSQDPQAVNSRVFVGNLNTFQCSKTDVERMFQRYGRLAGEFIAETFISIQFKSPRGYRPKNTSLRAPILKSPLREYSILMATSEREGAGRRGRGGAGREWATLGTGSSKMRGFKNIVKTQREKGNSKTHMIFMRDSYIPRSIYYFRRKFRHRGSSARVYPRFLERQGPAGGGGGGGGEEEEESSIALGAIV
jgi:RNA recognition motif-containing protein